MELIDAGLMFNSPYPPLLRKQRSVDLILSFDFSARETDEERPFKVIVTSNTNYFYSHLGIGDTLGLMLIRLIIAVILYIEHAQDT